MLCLLPELGNAHNKCYLLRFVGKKKSAKKQ